jgi:hypothetical protein
MPAIVTDDMFKNIALEGKESWEEPKIRVRGSQAFLYANNKTLMLDRKDVSELMQLLLATADVMDKQKSIAPDEPYQRMGGGE